MKILKHMIMFYKKRGIKGFTTECYYRLTDTFYENYFGVHTKGDIAWGALGLTNEEHADYAPVFYKHIFEVLNKLPVDKNKSVFLDFGCGKGRALFVAAECQYKKIIGVEISDLIEKAKTNRDNSKFRESNNIDLEHCDATKYSIPSDVNIIYFYNPFGGSVLEAVINNIHASFKKNPRKIYIVYFNNKYFEPIASQKNWLHKTEQTHFHRNGPFGLYEIDL